MKKKQPLLTNTRRRTIGVLSGWAPHHADTPDRYVVTVFRGIQAAACARDCHLLLALGVGRPVESGTTYSAWPLISDNSDFVPVGPWNSDGLIVFAPLLSETRTRYLQQVMAEGYPVLFIGSGAGSPAVVADNAGGIRQAMDHLVEHGHQRIVFIAGDPTDQGDSTARLAAYHSAVIDYGLAADSRLIAHGWHDRIKGQVAMQRIIESGVEFTAVLASDDLSAIGAMRALQDAGLNVPHNVALVGFDDQPDAVSQIPPLATIHVPLAEIGYRAVTFMLEHLKKGTPLESVWLPTQLRPRQSCGCLPATLLSAADGGSRRTPVHAHSSKTTAQGIRRIKQKLIVEMAKALSPDAQRLEVNRLGRLCTGLVEALASSLNSRDPAQFQAAMTGLLQEVELADADISPWQEAISVLRREVTRLPHNWHRSDTRRFVEDLLHQARAIISESLKRADHRHQDQRDAALHRLGVLTTRLSVLLNEQEAVEILATHLPGVGIRHCRVVLFGPEKNDVVAWSRVVPKDPESAGLRFPSRQFPPPGLYAAGERLNLALLPLVFQDEALGYVAFEASDLQACVIIARQLAATLKSARLHAQVVTLSLTDSLTGLNNRRYFNIFLQNEVKRDQRFRRGLAVILLDLDCFKEYNDTFGHPAGDEALQRVARSLLKERREMDVVVRYGGEEFALLLPETDMASALRVAERIRILLAALSDLRRPITASLGVAVAQAAEYDAETLVQQADQALYKAKRAGRNCVCMHFHG